MAKKKQKRLLYGKICLFTVGIHWMFLILSYFLIRHKGGSADGLWQFFYNQFVQAGDTPHYIEIAKHGYASSGENAKYIVFYPLYPLLVRMVQTVVRDYFVAGVLVSNVCLAVSGCYLYKIIAREYGKNKGWDGVFAYSLYPFGMFLIGMFTESLFIMLLLMCLYYIQKESYVPAAVTGFLAALTRTQGIVLLVPFVYEWLVQCRKQKRFLWQGMMCLGIPLGTVVYFFINQIVQGDWFAFVKHQAAEPWYNTSKWIAVNLAQHFDMGKEYFGLGLVIYWVQLLLYFAVMLLLFYGLKKKVRVSFIAFGGAYIFVSYLQGWMISGPRYMLSCVAIYIIFASIKNTYVKGIWLGVSAMLSVLYTMLFMQGHAIM